MFSVYYRCFARTETVVFTLVGPFWTLPGWKRAAYRGISIVNGRWSLVVGRSPDGHRVVAQASVGLNAATDEGLKADNLGSNN